MVRYPLVSQAREPVLAFVREEKESVNCNKRWGHQILTEARQNSQTSFSLINVVLALIANAYTISLATHSNIVASRITPGSVVEKTCFPAKREVFLSSFLISLDFKGL